ncbi:hypothetical protein ELH50_15740 [Rhizobium ruizarguesonis]|uniref:hypothetical protein n=1 Tax=Rhizobium ruizarguesonis TaxID=2081791 RepID=UPI001031E7F4|nr:hypothetical protein [Rhizobium ruizarguesonis]TBB12443.1 hypothetical protein ELH50_15740 [Rhizobium ruizarguesonis]
MTTIDDDPYKYGFISSWLQFDYEKLLETAQIQELRAVADTYKINMIRVRNLGMLLPEVAYWTRITTRLGSVANARLGRPIELPGRIRGVPAPDQAFQEEAAKQHAEWFKIKPEPGEAWQDGNDLVKALVSVAPTSHGIGLQALMSAILLETWSAFEGLLIDTWKTALNLAPNSLSAGVLGNEKSIPVAALQRYGFNVADKLGDVLSDIPGKVDLASLSGIKKAYKAAFAEADPEAIFNAYDPALSHFEAIRHLFAHRAGKVDERFLRRVRKDADLSAYQVGDELKINGLLVSQLTDAAVRCAVEVHSFVDSWLLDLRTDLFAKPE